MIRLYAGPWIGELGWLLHGWQGYLRYIAQDYDRVIIIGEPQYRYLYDDFCDYYMDYEVEGNNPNMWMNDLHSYRNPLRRKGDVWIKPQQLTLMENAPQQKFRKYGKIGEHKGFDIVCHSRSINKYGSGYVNTPIKIWTEVLGSFNGLEVASIGTKQGADHIPGTVDCRGVTLEELANILANSKLLIGPSSGPMHYGALCGIPLLVWSGYDRSALRYQTAWNPLKSPVKVLSVKGNPWDKKEEWYPQASVIVESMERLL